MSRRLMLTRRSLILSSAGLAIASRASAQEMGLPFLVVGDWGQPYAPAQRLVAQSMGRVANDIASRFVISTGDNFYRHGVTSVDDSQWQATFEAVYAAPSLQEPWFAVLGNHDYEGSPAAEVDYSVRSHRWRMRSRYWREDMNLPTGESVSFFFLDTTPIVALSQAQSHIPFVGASGEAHAQLRWLERELASCDSSWKFVVGHHPVASSGSHGASSALARLVRPLLERYGVRIYFNGHDHDLEHIRSGPVDYICSGAGAEARPIRPIAQSRFAYARQGFAACVLSRDELRLTFHDIDGARLYDTAIARVAS